MARPSPPTLAIIGPTASGKTRLAFALVNKIPSLEVVSADAMAVYKAMPITTAAPTLAERAKLPHHCIEVVEPWVEFSLGEYLPRARRALNEIHARSGTSMVLGGTGMYSRAAIEDPELPGTFPEVRERLNQALVGRGLAGLYEQLQQIDPLAASRMEPTNERRILRALEVSIGLGRKFSSLNEGFENYPPIKTVMFGLALEGASLDAAIEARFDSQLADGWLDEIEALRLHLQKHNQQLSRTASRAIGVKQLERVIEKSSTIDEARESICLATRQLARRQLRWFRRDSRIVWLDSSAETDVQVGQILRDLQL